METGRFYIGSAENPSARLLEHNRGKTRSTKPYLPWSLVWQEAHQTRAGAMRRERYLKSLKSRVALERLTRQSPGFD